MKLLGTGWHRNVYLFNATTVLKVRRNLNEIPENLRKSLPKNYNPNLKEWDTWNRVKGTEWEKYFCPCIKYTYDGDLYMIRAKRIDWKNNKNAQFPVFLHDRVSSNFGFIENRIVCVDYHEIYQLEHTMASIPSHFEDRFVE